MDQLERHADLTNNAYEAEVAWLRQILTLAAGALALLAGLGPRVPPDGPAQNLLAATWALLGIGIVAGAAATYAAVSRAKWIADHFRAEIEQFGVAEIEKIGPGGAAWIHLHSQMNPVLRVCKPLIGVKIAHLALMVPGPPLGALREHLRQARTGHEGFGRNLRATHEVVIESTGNCVAVSRVLSRQEASDRRRAGHVANAAAHRQPKSMHQKVLAGLIERVTFRNLENGFCLLRINARGRRDLVTEEGPVAMMATRDPQAILLIFLGS